MSLQQDIDRIYSKTSGHPTAGHPLLNDTTIVSKS